MHLALQANGLWHLVPRNDREAMMFAEQGKWDPLMTLHVMIVQQFIACYNGPPSMMNSDDMCPICFGAQHDGDVHKWIKWAAEGCRTHAIQHGHIYLQ